ncbi:hypothetical protein F751_1707 [Auxenochlorella protothecoides]|uniref:Uncharacterized protein n=1 Tax=Auxenochlorella protothecoides TaxID=3075 RepID=A0A087SGH4_AUXPR|nr:hypothetical protein F751_1707 [Auxenochlorella protothecoides]KFM24828.1 hypothetical protein F751_1707 [Auxenochlorella protothecoides]
MLWASSSTMRRQWTCGREGVGRRVAKTVAGQALRGDGHGGRWQPGSRPSPAACAAHPGPSGFAHAPGAPP